MICVLKTDYKSLYQYNSQQNYYRKTHLQELGLIFPLNKFQVYWGTWAEQAVGFSFDVICLRRHLNVKLLNELQEKQKSSFSACAFEGLSDA